MKFYNNNYYERFIFCNFFKNFFIYSNELRPVKAEIRLNGGRLRGSLQYFKSHQKWQLMHRNRRKFKVMFEIRTFGSIPGSQNPSSSFRVFTKTRNA